MTTVDDLAAWLTAIWDERERDAREAIALTERAYPADEFDVTWRWARLTSHKTSGGGGQSFAPGAPSPTAVLARIAADRQILALHRVEQDCGESGCVVCDNHPDDGILGGGGDGPCTTIRLLALPHADRPGYQEEWRPA